MFVLSVQEMALDWTCLDLRIAWLRRSAYLTAEAAWFGD
jgi:hypothetical protein